MERFRIAAVLAGVASCGGGHSAIRDAHGGGDEGTAVDAKAAHLVAYVSGYGPDLARFEVARDTGALESEVSLAAWAGSPSFLAVDPAAKHLYAVSESDSRVGAYAIDPATGALTFLDDAASGGTGPAHLSVDATGKYVLAANYGDGRVAVLAVGGDGSVSAPQQVVLAGTNAHQIITDPSNRFAFVPCLGSNWIAQYTFDAATGALAANSVPHYMTATGAGPRHLAFSGDGKFAYLIAEKTSELSALALDGTTGRLSHVQTISTLPAGFSGSNTGAEVAVHPSGKFVLASNRGDDSIAVFARDGTTGRLTLVGHTKTGGTKPRHFSLDPAGRFVYVANQGSNNVVVLAFDAQTGALTATGASVSVQAPSFVGLVALP